MKEMTVSIAALIAAMGVSTWAAAESCGGPGEISCNVYNERVAAEKASNERMEQIKREVQAGSYGRTGQQPSSSAPSQDNSGRGGAISK
jgi:hypothetical protein